MIALAVNDSYFRVGVFAFKEDHFGFKRFSGDRS